MAANSAEITQVLVAWSNGDRSALEKLAPLVSRELHRLAKHYMARERPGHTLQTSALVNEAYLRLVNVDQVQWQFTWDTYQFDGTLVPGDHVEGTIEGTRISVGSAFPF